MEILFDKLLQRSSYRNEFLTNKPLPKKYYKFPICNINNDLYPEEVEIDNRNYDWCVPAAEQQKEINADINNNFDMSVIKAERYKTLYDWMHSWHLKNPIGQIHNQQPGQSHPFHMDVINSYNKYIPDPKEKQTRVKRVFVFLNDWSIGQIIMMGTKTITGWKKGDVIWFDWWNVPHGTANFGRTNRMMLQITGETTPAFEKLILE